MNRKIGAALAVLLGTFLSLVIQHRAHADGSSATVSASDYAKCIADKTAAESEAAICKGKPAAGTATSAALTATAKPPPPKPVFTCVDTGAKVDDPSKCEPCPPSQVLVTGKLLTDKICVDKGLLNEIDALKKRIDALEKKVDGLPKDNGDLAKLKDDVQKLKEDLAKCVSREEFNALKARVDNLEPSFWAFLETFCNHPLKDVDKTPEGIKQYTKDYCPNGQKSFHFEAKFGLGLTAGPAPVQFSPQVAAKFIGGADRVRLVVELGLGDAYGARQWIGFASAGLGPRFCLDERCNLSLDALLRVRQQFHTVGQKATVNGSKFDNTDLSGTTLSVGLDFTYHFPNSVFMIGAGGWIGSGQRLNWFETNPNGASLKSGTGLTGGGEAFVGFHF